MPPGPAVAPRAHATLEHRGQWERSFRRRLTMTDTLVVLATVAATTVLSDSALAQGYAVSAGLAAGTALIWIAMLSVVSSRATTITGSGSAEYARVVRAGAGTFVALAIAYVAVTTTPLRPFLLLALPIGTLALLMSRWLWRQWLLSRRAFGRYAARALVVGAQREVEYVVGRLQRHNPDGFILVGVVVDDPHAHAVIVDGRRYEAVGSVDSVADAARERGADTIIVAGQPDGAGDYTKELAWQLEGTAAELILSNRLIDVAGPRISLRQVDGLPLVRVRIPTFEGGRHTLKRAFDIVGSLGALTLVGLLTPLIALAVVIDSRGPLFYRQTRIGRDGREFEMLKFRSMRTDADAMLAALLAENEGAGPLFKMKKDPRITRVGAVLRKFSLDELPQFWNVLKGDMSIVGPRPPLPREVCAYDGTAHRRLYISPGITGLWQVSGRSDLSWEESVELDLHYVENWSLTTDLIIMWRTVKVMIAPQGAY